MRSLMILVTLGVAAWAAPDVSHLGSSAYNLPTSSFLPTKGYLPGDVHYVDSGSDLGVVKHQKHFFYYSIPNEVSASRLRVHILPSNTKNTNVVFVKAPTSGPVVPEIITSPHHAEEKTKVYVLVKNQDRPSGTIKVPLPVSVKSRPEVYVVKYDNEHEAQHLVSGYHQGETIPGVHVENLGDEGRFISVIQSELNKGAQITQEIGHDGYYYGRSARSNAVEETKDSAVSSPEGVIKTEKVEGVVSSTEGSSGIVVVEGAQSDVEKSVEDKSTVVEIKNVEGVKDIAAVSVSESSISSSTTKDA